MWESAKPVQNPEKRGRFPQKKLGRKGPPTEPRCPAQPSHYQIGKSPNLPTKNCYAGPGPPRPANAQSPGGGLKKRKVGPRRPRRGVCSKEAGKGGEWRGGESPPKKANSPKCRGGKEKKKGPRGGATRARFKGKQKKTQRPRGADLLEKQNGKKPSSVNAKYHKYNKKEIAVTWQTCKFPTSEVAKNPFCSPHSSGCSRKKAPGCLQARRTAGGFLFKPPTKLAFS